MMRKRKTNGLRFPKSILALTKMIGRRLNCIKTLAGWVFIISLAGCAGNPERVVELEPTKTTVPKAGEKTPDTKPEKQAAVDDTAMLLENARKLRATQPELFNGAKGILVLDIVPGSQAEEAGFQRGDIVVGYQEQVIDSNKELINRVVKVPFEQNVVVDIIRQGRGMRKDTKDGKLGIEIRNIGSQLDDELAELNQAGKDANDHSEYRKAIQYWEQGLAKARAAYKQDWIGPFLFNLGVVYKNLGQYPRAIEFYQQALAIQSQVGAPEPLWRVWSNLRAAHTKLNQPARAIFFGKQAVNVIQGMRTHNVKLEKGLQKSFLKDKEFVKYRWRAPPPSVKRR